MSANDNNERAEQSLARERNILRFVFQNAGGLLALAGVIFSSGMFMQEIKQLKERGTAQELTMQRVETTTQEIKTDVEVIRERVSNQNNRINNLEARK